MTLSDLLGKLSKELEELNTCPAIKHFFTYPCPGVIYNGVEFKQVITEGFDDKHRTIFHRVMLYIAPNGDIHEPDANGKISADLLSNINDLPE